MLAALLLVSAPAGTPTVVNDGHGDYVSVPAGAFRMGDNFADGDPRERPVHVVELDAFFIAKLEMTNGEWNEVLDVNLNGAFWCLREAARIMSQQKSGAIINIASIMALRGGLRLRFPCRLLYLPKPGQSISTLEALYGDGT